jgi:hypothetical protein
VKKYTILIMFISQRCTLKWKICLKRGARTRKENIVCAQYLKEVAAPNEWHCALIQLAFGSLFNRSVHETFLNAQYFGEGE